ncbi:histidine kinase [Actinoplanes sp. NBRC 103695]|uniref:sensor histidine kinase n=1 Tax=Actinoplanes sp. NBRC 103695 TaxID=3032202 RepID=UPI00255296EF|nr:histidine kinase [Actinoplanes sp. NBRC 103695]
MSWVSRLFDARDTLVRLILLDLSGLGYLLFGAGHDGTPPTTLQWVLAVAAFAGILLPHRNPMISFVAQSALLAVAFCLVDDATINLVGSSWMLFEVTMWAGRLRTVGWCAALLVAVHVVDTIGDPFGQLTSNIFGLIVVIGVPLLGGMVVRTTRELGQQAAERAVEEERRRESEGRAARADERTAIARELHDVVAHHVASMVLRVGVARHVLPGLDPKAAEVFDDVHRSGTTALADLRRLVAVLRDPNPDGVRDPALTAIDPSALPAVLDGAVETARRGGLVVEADISGPLASLDAVRGLAVLRLTQEALTNVAKHAGATAHARLTVAVAPDEVTWEVSDDGGANPSVSAPLGSGGHGLTGMRERVEVLGGTLEAGPYGNGWRVRTVLPAAVLGDVA